MGLVVGLAVGPGLAGEAHAEGSGLRLPTAVFVGTQALDLHSTWLARSSGAGVEANPRMDVGPGSQIAIKAAVTLGVIAIAHVAERRRHPRLAKGLLWTASAVTLTVAAHNYQVVHR